MTPIVETFARKLVTIAIAASALAAAGVIAAGADIEARAQGTPSASSARAKELAATMKTRKLEAFAMREAAPNRFLAVICNPDVQILLVSTAYGRPSDIEYRLFQKDYVTAYRDLRSGVSGTERFVVEDILADGLVAVPAKNSLPDTAMVDATTYLFEGPADPKKRNDKRMPADAYAKAFGDSDQRYAQALDALIAELKKAATLEPAGLLR